MPGGKCRKCGCDSFSMDIFQGGANILNWGVASAARIMGGGDKDESAALKKCGCGHHYNYHEKKGYFHATNDEHGDFEIAWGVSANGTEHRYFKISYMIKFKFRFI